MSSGTTDMVGAAGGISPAAGPPSAATEVWDLEVTGKSASKGGHALVLANRLPWPLDDGWKVRTFHVIRGVSTHARCTVIVFHPSSDTETIASAARALGPEVRLLTVDPPPSYTASALVRGLLTRYPVHVWNQESPGMRRLIADVVAADPVDVVVAESTFVARYLDLVPAGVPHIIDTHNIDSVTFGRYASALRPGPRRLYASITARKLATFEATTFRQAHGVWVCSDIERDLVRRMAPSTRVWTVPNGVDTTFFSPSDAEPVTDRVLFFGRLDYYPNIDGLAFFAREILPPLKRLRPGVSLHVVGAAATREVLALAHAEPAIELVGRVADLRVALRSASVVAVPLRVGGGTRLKVLEALSMGLPVVSTTIGAEGIDVDDDRHLVLADDPAIFAESVATLLADPAAARRLGDRGRSLVREKYDWAHVADLVGRSLVEVVEAERE